MVLGSWHYGKNEYSQICLIELPQMKLLKNMTSSAQISSSAHEIHNDARSLSIIESSRKNIYYCFIDYVKAFDCVDHNKLWKILRQMGIPDHLTCLLRNLYAIRKQQLELDMEQQTGSK